MEIGQPPAAPPRPDLDGNGTEPSSRHETPPRRGRLAWGIAAAAGLAAIAAIVWLAVGRDGSGNDTNAASKPATTTAKVERRDLIETETVSGTLGFSGSRPVVFLAPGVAASGSGGIAAAETGSASASTANASYPDSAGKVVAIAYSADGDPGTGGTTDEIPPATTGEEPPPTTTGEEPPPATTGEEPPPATTGEESPPATAGETPSVPSGGTATTGATAGAIATGGGSTGSTTASSQSSTGGQSTIVTWLPEVGSTIRTGGVLFRVNGKATILMDGGVPAWRTLREGETGRDVRQLEQNLVAMGYDPKRRITVDPSFGPATKAAVKRWQRDLDIEQTGRVKLGNVVFLPGNRRISAVEIELGTQIQAGTTVLTTSSTRQAVTVALETSKRDLVEAGDGVSVELPGGSDVTGTITAIGTVATASSEDTQTGQGQTSGSGSDATVEMTIALDSKSGSNLDQTPVDVKLTKEERVDVLAVPVTALLALRGRRLRRRGHRTERRRGSSRSSPACTQTATSRSRATVARGRHGRGAGVTASATAANASPPGRARVSST